MTLEDTMIPCVADKEFIHPDIYCTLEESIKYFQLFENPKYIDMFWKQNEINVKLHTYHNHKNLRKT